MNSTADPLGFPTVQLAGPILLAFSMDWALFGTLTVQLYLYYQAFPKDGLFTKCLVYTAYLINLTQVVFVTIDAFNAFAYGFGDYGALTRMAYQGLVAPVFGGIVACIVQSFYAFRLYKFSGSWIVPSILLCGAVGIGITGIIDGVSARATDLSKLNMNLPEKIAATTGVMLVGAAIIDITIAACMTYYLARSDTGFRRTHALITKLIRLSIETGIITALMALLILGLFFGLPGKAYYSVPGTFFPMVYANTMFAVLNSRFQILNGRAYVPTSDILMSIPSHLRDTVPGTAPVVTITREEFSTPSEAGVELKGIHTHGINAP
ncbi:hypothetical protein C8R46DRAFT_1140630 [Mycena filopes]|nr:hypothetical protein C8R46DRAFT_1140630 [Mycena filopes]